MPGSFLQVRCPECENEQVVFEKASSPVACAVCGQQLVSPSGGKAEVAGEIVETVHHR